MLCSVVQGFCFWCRTTTDEADRSTLVVATELSRILLQCQTFNEEGDLMDQGDTYVQYGAISTLFVELLSATRQFQREKRKVLVLYRTLPVQQ
jgi:hypothetical protein